mmetsp:Transcript_19132/g.46207  ORF Transcript_19132/g.46207 Transcript_19132/m.46207 type:complete len:92 (+) Transcript_19132:864-1139(+)
MCIVLRLYVFILLWWWHGASCSSSRRSEWKRILVLCAVLCRYFRPMRASELPPEADEKTTGAGKRDARRSQAAAVVVLFSWCRRFAVIVVE